MIHNVPGDGNYTWHPFHISFKISAISRQYTERNDANGDRYSCFVHQSVAGYNADNEPLDAHIAEPLALGCVG